MNDRHILSGIRWTLYTSVFRRLFTLVFFYFVAKWLYQRDLGTFRTYGLILTYINIFTVLSLDHLYILEKRHSISALVTLLRYTTRSAGIGFFFLMVAAPLLGRLYHHNDDLFHLFTFFSVFLIVEVLRKALYGIASRRQQFRTIALAETANVVFYTLIGIPVLYFSRNVYAYVVVFYAGNLVELIWYLAANLDVVRPAYRFVDTKLGRKAASLTMRCNRSFIMQATGVSALGQFANNAPILLLGVLVDPIWLGLYFFASQLVGVPVGMFTQAIGSVFYPVFARREDSRIASMSHTYIRLVSMVGIPLLMLFGLVLHFLTLYLWHGKWREASVFIPAMLVFYGTALYSNPLSGIPFVKRKPGWELVWNACALVLKVGALLIGMHYSLYHEPVMAIWWYALATAASNLAFYLMSMYLVGIRLWDSVWHLAVNNLPVVLLILWWICMPALSVFIAITGMALLCVAIILLGNSFSSGKLLKDVRLLIR